MSSYEDEFKLVFFAEMIPYSTKTGKADSRVRTSQFSVQWSQRLRKHKFLLHNMGTNESWDNSWLRVPLPYFGGFPSTPFMAGSMPYGVRASNLATAISLSLVQGSPRAASGLATRNITLFSTAYTYIAMQVFHWHSFGMSNIKIHPSMETGQVDQVLGETPLMARVRLMLIREL
eukprot:IDg6259t1